MRRGEAALAAFGLALPLAAFGLMELAARRWAPPGPPPASEEYRRFLLESSRPMFRREGTRLVQTTYQWKVDRDQAFADPKPAGLKRLLVAGESTADLVGKDLRRRLAAVKGWEVVNCAVGAGSVEYIEKRFNECLELSPDALVLLIGHNARYRHPDHPLLALIAEPLRRNLRLLSWLGRPAARGPEPRARDGERLEKLRRFVSKAVQEFSARRLPAVVVLPASNLRVAPGAGDPAADAAWAEGDGKDSRPALERARDLDPKAMRADAGVYAALREAARGAALVDGEALIRARAPGGIPGWESFSDVQHLRPEGISLLAEKALLALSLPPGPPLPPPPPGRRLKPFHELKAAVDMAPLEDPHLWPTLTAYFRAQPPGYDAESAIRLAFGSGKEAEIARRCWAEARKRRRPQP